MTRFREISSLWQIYKLKIFGNLFKVNLVLGKVLNSLWHILYAFGQIFIAVNGQILKTQSFHLVTLVGRYELGPDIGSNLPDIKS